MIGTATRMMKGADHDLDLDTMVATPEAMVLALNTGWQRPDPGVIAERLLVVDNISVGGIANLLLSPRARGT